MEVRILKPFKLGPRLFAVGDLLETENPAYVGISSAALLEAGIAEVVKRQKAVIAEAKTTEK